MVFHGRWEMCHAFFVLAFPDLPAYTVSRFIDIPSSHPYGGMEAGENMSSYFHPSLG